MKCQRCNQQMIPVKQVSMCWTLFWLAVFFPIAILIHVGAKADRCPLCKQKAF